MTIDQARRDYANDATYRAVVDTIESWIREAQVSPAEARTAAMLAAIHYEEKRPLYAFPPRCGTYCSYPLGHEGDCQRL